MNKKDIVQLTSEERTLLEQRTRTGTAAASVQRHARILLKADTAEGGPAWDDATIAQALDVSVPTVERGRQRFVQSGLELAIGRKPTTRSSQRKLDGNAEAQLIALTCSTPPEGACRWTLALLADKLVALNVVDSIARATVQVALKKTNSNRG